MRIFMQLKCTVANVAFSASTCKKFKCLDTHFGDANEFFDNPGFSCWISLDIAISVDAF